MRLAEGREKVKKSLACWISLGAIPRKKLPPAANEKNLGAKESKKKKLTCLSFYGLHLAHMFAARAPNLGLGAK